MRCATSSSPPAEILLLEPSGKEMAREPSGWRTWYMVIVGIVVIIVLIIVIIVIVGIVANHDAKMSCLSL